MEVDFRRYDGLAVGAMAVTHPAMPRPAGAVTPMHHELLLIAAIIYLAAFLRVLSLGEKSFWLDEATSLAIARLDWSSFLAIVTHREPGMSLYYAILHFWRRLGESEAAIRGLSVFPAVATLPVVHLIGKRTAGVAVGLLAALLLALNALDIRYAQEARGYSLLIFLTTLATFLFIKGIERPSRGLWAGYAATAALAIYTHFFAAFVIAAHLVSLAALRPRDIPVRALAASLSGIAALVLPLVIAAWDAVRSVPALPAPSLPGLYYTLMAITGAGGVWLLVAYALSCLAASPPIGRTWASARASVEAWRYGLVVAWLVMPIVLALGISFITPILSARYLVVCLPPLSLLAAIGLASIRPRWACIGATAVVAALAIHGIVGYFVYFPKEDWRDATRFVMSQGRPGDALLFYPLYDREPFDYYHDRLGGAGPAVVFPEQPYVPAIARGIPIAAEPGETLLDRLPARYPRVWLILGRDQLSSREGYQASRAVHARLLKRYPSTRQKTFYGILVVLYSKAGGTALQQ